MLYPLPPPQNYLHELPAAGAGGRLQTNTLPRHVHEGGAGHEDRSDRGKGAGEEILDLIKPVFFSPLKTRLQPNTWFICCVMRKYK